MKKLRVKSQETSQLHGLCVKAFSEMVMYTQSSKHVSFITQDDELKFGIGDGKKIGKVTIEWVDSSENDPKNFEAA